MLIAGQFAPQANCRKGYKKMKLLQRIHPPVTVVALFVSICAPLTSFCQSVAQADIEKSVLQVVVKRPDGAFASQGTAFCVSDDGLLASVFHVYAGAVKAVSDLRGGAICARRTARNGKWVVVGLDIVGADPKFDLIVYRMKDTKSETWMGVGGLQTLPLANTATLTLPYGAKMVGYFGEDAFPVHLRSDIVGTASVIVGSDPVEEFLVSGLLLPGHSGSPVVNDAGAVVGLVSSIVPVNIPLNPSQPMHSGLVRVVKAEHLKKILSDIGSK
jgi:S1-C subfamily serine protease